MFSLLAAYLHVVSAGTVREHSCHSLMRLLTVTMEKLPGCFGSRVVCGLDVCCKFFIDAGIKANHYKTIEKHKCEDEEYAKERNCNCD